MSVIEKLGDRPSGRRAARRELPGRRPRRLRRHAVLLVVAVLLAPVAYSYVTAMLRPSSLPLGIRSVEWVRTHHGAWLVDEAERVYYGWTAPKPGGPALKTLPKVGYAPAPPPPPRGARRVAAAAFQPPRLVPRVTPRLAGEGVWRSTGRVVDGAPPVLVTTFRPDPAYPRLVAYAAWFDHSRTQLALYPGRYEPPNAVPRGPMQVPHGERWRLLATFNSGFMYRDGHGGFFFDGHSAEPLVKGQGTVVAYADGRVDVVSWRGGPTPPRGVVLARQNLPLIVDNGRPNPLLGDNSRWGSTLGNAIRVWRSAVGVDRHGNLLYVAANDQTAAAIADVAIRAGAVRAIELDINAEWPTLVTYGHGGTGNATKVVPNYQQPTGRYLVPDDRDFFAVYRLTTPAALSAVPLR